MPDASPPSADVATPEEARLWESVRAGRDEGAFERLEAAWLARGACRPLVSLYRERAGVAHRLPWRMELLARLAELLEAELEDADGAAAVYGQMAQEGDEAALEEQLRLLRARGDRSGTWRALDLAVERARVREARCHALTRRGQAALEAGEPASARADFAAVLSLEPGHLDALTGLSQQLPAEDEPAPLLALEAAVERASPGAARDERYRQLARLADARPDCTGLSLRAWRALAASRPTDAEATERLTALLSAPGNEAELVPVLQARIARAPRGEGARALRHQLVRALDALGRDEAALEALRDAVRAEPGNHEAWRELADRAEGTRHAEYAWALEHAATSTVEPAERARLWRRLGAFLEQVPGKQEDARACLDRAARLERAVKAGASALGPLVQPPRPRAGQPGQAPPARVDTEVIAPEPPEDRIPTAPRPPPPAPPSIFVDMTPVFPHAPVPALTPVRPFLTVGPEPTPMRPLPAPSHPGATAAMTAPELTPIRPVPAASRTAVMPVSPRSEITVVRHGGGPPPGTQGGEPGNEDEVLGWRAGGSLSPPAEDGTSGAPARRDTWPGEFPVDGVSTDPGLSALPVLPDEAPEASLTTDPGVQPVLSLLAEAPRGARPPEAVPTVAPRTPALPARLLEPSGWHAYAEARARAGDGWLAALSREVAQALEGVAGPLPEEPPRWLLGASERAQLVPVELSGPLAALLSAGGAALVSAAHASSPVPPAPAFGAGAGPGAPAALEALAAAVRVLGLRSPPPECMPQAGPPFALAAGAAGAVRFQVGALAVQRVLPAGELRFFAGRALFTQAPLLRVLRLVPPERLEALLAALPDAVRGGRRLSPDARLLRSHLPDGLRAQLWDGLDALEEAPLLDELSLCARHAANRAGLVACGGVGAAVLALRSKRALEEEVEALLRFAASDRWRALSAPWTPVSALPAGGR